MAVRAKIYEVTCCDSEVDDVGSLDGPGTVRSRIFCRGGREEKRRRGSGESGLSVWTGLYFDVGGLSADRGSPCADGGKIPAGGTAF